MDKVKTVTATVLEAHGNTLAELQWKLSKTRGRRVPLRTLQFWLKRLAIESDEHGFYSDEDLQVLRRLVLFLRRKRNIEAFIQIRLQEIEECQQTTKN